MRDNDVDLKIKEALVRARGDANGAIRLLAQACGRDDKLLRALVAPFMQGILFQAVQRVGRQLTGKNLRVPAKPVTRRELPPEVLDEVIDKLGTKIPTRSATSAARPKSPAEALQTIGRDPEGPPPSKAGKQHQAAMHALAKSFNFTKRG
jgi:hypothetical protein